MMSKKITMNMQEKHRIQVKFIDHVAIRVENMERSASWYEKVLGLNRFRSEKWGDYPIFMLQNKCGIALFPADIEDEKLNLHSRNVKIDHFAFNVNQENFDKAIENYKRLGLEFEVKNHFYFESVYTKDPDGHTVELTTLKVDEDDFYNK